MKQPREERSVPLGLLALFFFAAHAGMHAWRGHPENALWSCHLGALAMGVGLLVPAPRLTAIGAFWLTAGLPLWLFNMATSSEEFLPTSPLTHVGALVIGYVGMRRQGIPKHTWWISVLAMLALVIVSRGVTPPGENVNLSHRVWDGWETVFPSHLAYLAMFLAGFSVFFAALQWALRRAGFARSASP